MKLPPGTRVPDSYYCPLCKLLLRNAVQTSEGDRLCEVCFKTIAKYGDNMHARHLRVVPPNFTFASRLLCIVLYVLYCMLD